MGQLHLYVPSEVEERVRQRAIAQDKSVSQVLADVIKREFENTWPEDFLEKYTGFWQGPPVEIEDLPLEERDFEIAMFSEPLPNKSEEEAD